MNRLSACILAFGVFSVSAAHATDRLPMFATGKVDFVFEHDLTINGQVINRAGKQVAPMGSPRSASLCYRDMGSMLDKMSGFLPATNGVVKPSGQKDNCTYADLKVNGNKATFNVSCASGSTSVPSTVGKVEHNFDPATNQISQKFVGSNLYGKAVEETHVYNRVGACP